jgi:hypothetical protein
MAGRHSKFLVCTLWFCNEPHYGRGLCARHYQNWLRTRNPLPDRSNDLRYALTAVDQYSEVARDFMSGNNAYLVTMDGDTTVSCKCRFCGQQSRYKHTVVHEKDCVVRRAEELVIKTQSKPPEDEFTYELDLSITENQDKDIGDI